VTLSTLTLTALRLPPTTSATPPRFQDVDVVEKALAYREALGGQIASNGELAAFISYAQAFPHSFLALVRCAQWTTCAALRSCTRRPPPFCSPYQPPPPPAAPRYRCRVQVDTYDTLSSGVPNFIAVALALVRDCGHQPVGLRLDSGDLAYLSKEARRMLVRADEMFGTALASTCKIVASNDINEAVLHSLADQGHEVDSFGIGTNLVTCQAQPALGMVYKLVEVNGVPRIKLSQDASKVTIPGAKGVCAGVEGGGGRGGRWDGMAARLRACAVYHTLLCNSHSILPLLPLP
jgi:hypothetical protein